MKREKENYEMPRMEVIDILPESVLCGSSVTGSGEGSDISQDDF